MIIELVRRYCQQKYTIGKFYINGEYVCDSLENPIRNEKIYGDTAIPYGEYVVIMSHSPKFKRLLPELLNVQNDVMSFSNVRIHAGNTVNDTLACPLCGWNKLTGTLVEARKAEELLISKILPAWDRKERIVIKVVNYNDWITSQNI